MLEKEPVLPERLVDRLLSHLKKHLRWDSLLAFSPPFLAFSYLVIFLYQSAWITQEILIFSGTAVCGVALLVGILRRPTAPSARFGARLIDDRVEGKDRFVTLATIDPSFHPSVLVTRLRHEAAGLLHRIDLKKDFPYRVKGPFFVSLIGSLAVILLFHLLLQIGPFFTPQPSPVKKLGQRLSHVPRFSELARNFEALAVRMQEQRLSSEERRSLLQDLLNRVENQLAAERQETGAGNDLLSQAARTLRGLEQGLEKDQDKRGGGGELKTNLPEEGKGKGKGKGKELSKGKGEEGQGELSASEGKDLKGGRPPQGKTKEVGKKQREKDPSIVDKLKGGNEKKREIESLAEGELEGKGRGGKSKGGEIPRGATPDRFLQPWEQGEKGIKGARFVTVQLPEEETEGSPGEGSGKRRRLHPKVPVGNVPLQPPVSPDASPEKQPLPLEYRGLIR